MKKIFSLFVLALLSNVGIHAQQDAQYTNYMYNTMAYNPAYTGSRGVLSAFLLHRSQWVGLDGAPTSQAFSINSPLKYEKVGLGLSIVNDKLGPSQEFIIDGNVSYTIDVSDRARLAFGLRLGFSIIDVDFSKLNLQFPDGTPVNDPSFFQNIENRFAPMIGPGLYYYSDNYYLGVSAPNLIQTEHFQEELVQPSSTTFIAKERINYYIMGGYVFRFGEDWQFKPAALAKVVGGSPLQIDLSANVWYKEKLSLGLAYRWSAALSALVGFQVSDGLMIGYGYDADTTELGNFNSGSHEIFLRFEIFSNQSVESPRFF
ncbi:type IX secretion system membrane protein PorP/SprF [Sungkyunkwania multivorans]|uniref:Type IX secretion system membrane protein PorP/SprF n=1 Tax=Sungkyunkwania multivorans TaxID=1173618 RepID=A0ABW3D3C5_9FLAO